MTSLEKLEKRVIFERLVIGLEEPVLIKGIGEIQAKVDSGNGGYNVLHGTDIYEEGDMLHFTTVDGQGNPKHVATKLIDRLQVNIGGGHIQDRPVVELDIKFANTLYKKIPFSITDRSDNDLKILIAKSFVDDELNALIDVGEVNISKNNVQVDTVNESLNKTPEQITSEGDIDNAFSEISKGGYQTGQRGVIQFREDVQKIYNSEGWKKLSDDKKGVYYKRASEIENKIFGNRNSSSKTITVKDKETGVAGINMAYIENVDSLIALGFRLKALYAIFLGKQKEEEAKARDEKKTYEEPEDDKKWKKKVEKRIKNAYEYSKKYLKKRHRNISQFVQDYAKQTDIDAGLNESVIVKEGLVSNGAGWIANKTGLTKAIPAVVSGAGAMVSPEQTSGVKDKNKQNPEHEKYMESLNGDIEVFEKGKDTDKMLDIAYGKNSKPNISDKESVKKEIDNLLKGEDVLIKHQKLLNAKMSEAIDSDVKDGFWNSLNGTLRDIADTADQIYRGKFNGSLIGSSIGFFKKWMSGGGLLSKFFKGALGAYVFVNPFAALPLTIAYAVLEAARKAKSKQLNVDENTVNEFKESLNGLAKQAKELSVNTNKEVAEAKNLPKTDQEIISAFMKEDEGKDKKLSSAAGKSLGKDKYENPNLGADGLFPVIDYLERVDSKRMLNDVSDFRNFLNVNAISPQMLEQLQKEDAEAVEAEEDVKEVADDSRELFEHYSREAYSVLNEAGDEQAGEEQPTTSTGGGENGGSSTAQGGEEPMTEQVMDDVTTTAKAHIETFKGFFEELQRRKKFVLYYIPIEGKNSDVIKEVLKGKSLDQQLSKFYTQKRFSQNTFSTTLDTIVKEFNKANGEGVGTLMIVWNKDKKSKQREVVTGLEKEVYIIDFNHGEEKKEEEKTEDDNRFVDVLKDAKRADYPVSLKDFVEQFVGKKAKASDLLSGILQQAKGENYPFSKDDFKKTFMGVKKGNGMMESIKNAIKEIPSVSMFRRMFNSQENKIPFASKALRKKFNLGEEMPSKNAFKTSFNKQIRDKYQVRAGITN